MGEAFTGKGMPGQGFEGCIGVHRPNDHYNRWDFLTVDWVPGTWPIVGCSISLKFHNKSE